MEQLELISLCAALSPLTCVIFSQRLIFLPSESVFNKQFSILI